MNEKLITIPDDIMIFDITGELKYDVYIEDGIVDVVKLLWKNNIPTCGSCEGHSDFPAWIQISNNMNQADADIAIQKVMEIFNMLDMIVMLYDPCIVPNEYQKVYINKKHKDSIEKYNISEIDEIIFV